jgi:signal peptidase I
MFETILIISVIIISILFAVWIYSEKKLEGKFSKIISTVSFPFPLLALYAVFKLNISFGYILVGLTLVSLLTWVISLRTNLVNLQKEARSFFLILLGITIFRSFIYEPFQIPTESMIPQIQVGDFLVVDKFSYGLKNPIGTSTWLETRDPKKGEMVAFIPEHTICSSSIENAYPERNFDSSQEYLWQRYSEACTPLGLTFVKRLIAKEGDEVIYRNKELIVNGKKLKREFLSSNADEVLIKEFYEDKAYTIRLLENYRNQLTFGAERKWVVPKDYYFVMGDNRDNSADSRSWGFVPKQNVVGKPDFIWMHWECLTCLPSFSRNKFLK